MKNIRILLPLIILCAGLFAVINTFEDSYSITHNINNPFESITMPEVDADALIREDEENTGPGVRLRFAHAFDVDLGKEIKKDVNTQLLPLFISEVDGATRYIIPLRGKGLWGPIWGFIALEDDVNKVYGAVFDHEKETPGLGAEINTPIFQEPFAGKTIFEGEVFTPIKVIKGGPKEGDMHGVDGISGGTITSNGVSDMLSERLNMYLPYFNKIKLEK